MAKRNARTRVDSEEVMGEGSFVVFRPIKYGEAKGALFAADVSDEEKEEKMTELIADAIVEWDWVDDDDEPLLLPKDGFDLDELYTHEVKFLVAELLGVAKEKTKN